MPTVTYTNTTITGYNSTPPPDDGTAVAGNEITWARIKTQLTDPLNTAIASIDTNVEDAIAQLVACIGVSASSPSFAANKGGLLQSNVPSGAWTKVTYPVEEWDNAGDYDATTSVWTPSEAGEYEFAAFARLDPNTYSGTREYLLGVYKNGSLHKIVARVDLATEGQVMALGGTSVVKANGSTDYFELYLYHETGGVEEISGLEGRANLWGYRIS